MSRLLGAGGGGGWGAVLQDPHYIFNFVSLYYLGHRRRKVLNIGGRGQGSEYWGGGEEGANFSLAVN